MNRKVTTTMRVICLVLAVGMVLSALLSMFMFM